jgi:two-component system, NtrC family, sensor kinase
MRRWRRARPLVRAETLATSWEIFSVLLFSSAVVPAVFGSPWPSALFLGSLALSAALARPLAVIGRRGFLIAALIRFATWPAIITTLVGFDPKTVVASCGFGLMAGGMRRAIYRRELDPLPQDPSPVRLRSELRTQLTDNATVAGIVGGHVMLLFTVAFLRTESPVVFRAWWEIVPVLAILGTAGFTLAVRPATTHIIAALRLGPQGDREALIRALDQAVRLPRRLSNVNFAAWMGSTATAVLYLQPGPERWSWADAVMQLAFAGLFSWGVSFYQRAWHEDAVRPIVRRLRAWSGRRDATAPVDLRQRMLSDFGLPLIFTLALSLLASIGLYRTLGVQLTLREDFNAITALCASFLMLVLAVGSVFVRAAARLSEPLSRLAEAADKVASGHLDRAVPRVVGPSEVVDLGRSIERMRRALAQTIAELEQERAGLETNVELRTAELSAALEELKQAQSALIQGERMALIGELVAGVAHEIYNPLNAISGSIGSVARVQEEIEAMLAAYAEAEKALPESERRALADKRDELDLQGALDDLAGIVKVVQSASRRSVEIVGNLKSFSRAPSEPIPSDLHGGLSETLSLLRHRLRHRGIEVVERFGDVPEVVCRAGEINQVFMNLLTNAIQAVTELHPDGGGRIEVTTEASGDEVTITIADNGPGVPLALHKRIFDPFFTTKLRGEGTGLGLSISSEIVRRHGGVLSLESDASGARFVCRLPLAQPTTRSHTSRERRPVAPA